MATRETIKLLSRRSGNLLPRTTVSKIFSTTEGQWFDCSPSSLEITVLLPNCFKSPKYFQQFADACRWRRDIWRFMTSFVMWPVNSCLLTRQRFLSVARSSRICKIIAQQSKMRNIDSNEHVVIKIIVNNAVGNFLTSKLPTYYNDIMTIKNNLQVRVNVITKIIPKLDETKWRTKNLPYLHFSPN